MVTLPCSPDLYLTESVQHTGTEKGRGAVAVMLVQCKCTGGASLVLLLAPLHHTYLTTITTLLLSIPVCCSSLCGWRWCELWSLTMASAYTANGSRRSCSLAATPKDTPDQFKEGLNANQMFASSSAA